MLRRTLAVLFVASICWMLVPQAVLAQSDSGQIRIVVTDENAKTPVDLARVVLDGPVVTSELTRANGQVLFTDVPDGIYHARIAKSGYQQVTSVPFEVVNGRNVTVNVSLALSTTLKVIGTVVARSTAVVSTTSIGPESPQRKLSNDLADALNKLSGVSVSTSGDDSDATQTVSLEGHDASQTQLTLDGVPLNAPGTAGNLGGFATDLFSGASVHTGPQIGGLGGGVNFTTMQPTISWLSSITSSLGSNGRNNYSIGESGSFGKLGVAAQTTYRANPSFVDGEAFTDASGLDYSHNGDSTIYGDLGKLRYQFGDTQTLTGTFMSSTRNTNLVCLRITGELPCGYGPNNTSRGNVQMYSLMDNALVGETTLQASIYSNVFTNLQDELNRFVNGEASPIGFSSDSRTHGFTLNATLPARERHTISIQSYGTWSDLTTTPLVASANPYYNGIQSSNYSALQITDSIRSNDKLTLNESFGANRATGSQSSVLGSFGATWRPTSVDSFSGSYSLGGVAASPSRSTILTDPASLRFDCNGNVAYGNAPGDQPGASSSNSARVGYTRSFHGGNLTLQFYRQVQIGVVLPVQVNGTALVANGVLSPSYLAQVQALYDSPAGCGAGAGTPFDASRLYFSSPVGGVRRIYEGGSISGYVAFGNLVVQPYYNLNVSKAISNDPRIDNPFSITISGEQLPNVPLQKAGIVFDYKAPHSILEWLADAQYTAKNNPNNLPAYTTFDAGVSANLNTGTMTIAASNITNAYGGIFASPANAVPYYTANGIAIPTVARPLTPRTYSFTYSVKFGPGAQSNSHVNVPSIGRGERSGPAGGPGGPGEGPVVYGGGPGGPPPSGPGGERSATGGGGFRAMLQPLPSSPPSNPLDVNTSSPMCTSEAQTVAQKISTELKNYVAQINAAKTASGYPETMPAPQLDDATVTYHAMGSTYALTIVPKFTSSTAPPMLASQLATASPLPANGSRGANVVRMGGRGGAMRAFIGCLPLHLAQPDDVASKHLFAPKSAVFTAPQVTFMPETGLYVVARAPQAGQETFRVYALPSAPPSNPFQVRTSADTCTPDLRGIATQALTQLKQYFENGTKPSLWTIAPHQVKAGTFYELTPGDPAEVGALIMCGRVAAAAPADLLKLGYDGFMPPELNYTKALGLYIVRPQRLQPPPEAKPSPSPTP